MSQTLHLQHLILLNEKTALPLLARWAVAFAVTVTKWDSLRQTRKQLTKLDAHRLDDIGMTRSQAQMESAKPFWQP